jgi:predicted phage terminase large subunit-like protein
VTYNQTRSEEVAKEFMRIAESAGVLDTGSTLRQVRLTGGSTIIFTSIGGGLTGSPIDGVCLIDDPIKDGVDARSPTIRADTHTFWRSVARTRRHPGTSFIEMATRWHSEDLTGYLIGEGWRYINLKAISEGPVDADGRVIGDPLNRRPEEALWPSYKPVEFFAEDRADTYWWAAMYQGEPTPDGAQVFRDVTLCEEPPPLSKLRIAIGADFAYSAKKTADHSVAVAIGEDEQGICYVLDVVRVQVEPRQFRDRVLELQARYGAATTAFIARTEQGSVEFLRESGVAVTGVPATEDKLSRAIHVAAAWNSKRVKIPSGASWREAFVREVCGFTGVKDRHDDQVDALAGAYHGLRYMPVEPEQNIQPYQRTW